MAYVTYTLKRLPEPSGYVKTGSDLSVAVTDDSINAAGPTVLTGLLADQWVRTQGFVNAANNGYFQAKADAASGKILLQTPPLTHARLPGVSGNGASTPNAAGNQIVADLTIVADVLLADYTPASIQTLVAKWSVTGNLRCYALSVNTDGTLNYSWSTDGTAVISKNSTVASGIADLTRVRFKVTHDVNNGAAGNDVKFWKSTDNGATWTQIGSTVTTAGTTSLANKATPLEVGSLNAGTGQLAVGRIFYATVGAGLDPVPSQVFDATLATRASATFTATTGEVWTLATSGTPPALFQGPVMVIEAAGAVATLTGYKRGVGQSYSLEFYVEKADRSVKVDRTQLRALGGATETLLNRRDVLYDVTVLGPGATLITEALLPQYREFLASVEGGETFTLDRYGTVAAPVEPKQVLLASESYSEERLAGTVNAGVYRLAFQAMELPSP